MNVPGYKENVSQQIQSKNEEKLKSLKDRLLLEETAVLSI